ncbi:MAG TPA: imidazolonepropionase [Verrucomicrobiae bacterium]|nr:imidazolonepropionase [Verrucomicrobiae bacterium]
MPSLPPLGIQVKLLQNIGRLVTGTDRGVLTDAVVVFQDGRIAWFGGTRPGARAAELRPPARLLEAAGPDGPDEVDCGGRLVTAGLIDAHSHPLYAGTRHDEIARRSAGASYREAAREGGGIASTVRATRAAGRAELEGQLQLRLESWLHQGTTTLEAKTGYQLEESGELQDVATLVSLRDRPRLPRLAVTFLGAHDLPPGWDGDRQSYVDAVCRWSVPAARAGAEFCDVFCDQGAFSVAESRQVLLAGRAAGLRLRIHADELERTGAAQLAADLGCVSADHLLRAEAADAGALARAGVVATLCPVTALAMGCAPPARLLLDAGVTVALATDHNPGMSGTTSMSLVIALAVAGLGLSVDEALIAATRGGAAALHQGDRGRIEVGALADAVAWEADHEGAFAWAMGLRPWCVWRGGEGVAPVPVAGA